MGLFQKSQLISAGRFHEAVAERTDQWFIACFRITNDRDLAQDAVQDGLLNAWRQRAKFQGEAALHTWIHRIVINAALQIVRSRGRHVWLDVDYEMADSAPTPEANLQQHQFESGLDRRLSTLTEVERLCFSLRHLEQWRLREIADAFNIKEGAVKQAVFRAVKKLRTQMTDTRRRA